MVLMCKMISPGVFFIFSKFWFSKLLGGTRAKNGPKLPKILSHLVSQELYLIYCGFWYTCKMMISPAMFFQWFSGFVFQSLLINAKKEFWGLPHLNMCVIFSSSTQLMLFLWFSFIFSLSLFRHTTTFSLIFLLLLLTHALFWFSLFF